MNLLAKSGPKEVGLFDHSRDVAHAAACLFGTASRPSRLARAWARFFRIGADQVGAFHASLTAAAWLHDLGKANAGFQRMLSHRGEQTWRHEILGAAFLMRPESRDWLATSPDVVPETVVGAVLSHHLKANIRLPLLGACPSGAEPRDETLLFGEPDARRILAEFGRTAGAGEAPTYLTSNGCWSRDEAWRELDAFARRLKQLKHQPAPESRHRLTLSVKAALVAADALGSATVREGLLIEQWARSCFGEDSLTADWLQEHVLQPTIAGIEARSGNAFAPADFQTGASRLGDRAALIASCGAGKTMAAWMWARERLRIGGHRRVLFLYPTRATATEGFRDYAAWAGAEAALLHGTSAYDLEGMFTNPDDQRRSDAPDPRMFALGYWPRRVFSATIDSFLAFMAHGYASLCMLPVLAESVVIVDEVHSFDDAMFRALDGFLGYFDVPVLCMTATLTTDRRRTLVECRGCEPFPPVLADYPELAQLSAAPRYRVAWFETGADVAQRLAAAFVNGRKVMHVVNTVARCQDAAEALIGALERAEIPDAGSKVLCYHSRFRLCDRKARHEQVIQRFKNAPGALALVTTQVCEMSLDLDADVLATELAPFPSLVQRMGRCCRKWASGRTGAVDVYPPPRPAPYGKEELAKSSAVVRSLCAEGEPISQERLTLALADLESDNPFAADGWNAFLDSGLWASAKDDRFREGDEYTVDSVLDADVDAYLRARRGRSPEAEGFIVPVPRKFATEDTRLGRFLRRASSGLYTSALGFRPSLGE